MLSVIQIDIVSKIMMNFEDLVVLMDSILEVDGDYYELLDGGVYGDLGERINKFFECLISLNWITAFRYRATHKTHI